mmetsp:Transcript_15063/g.22560  ORF Transcript_15063/g.22560 Transcript_15063/m.22560 type:complete len:92 (-) Transcript_15063:456-731(-)
MTTTSKNTDSSKPDMTPEEALSNCLLSQYRFCAGGVLGGAAYGIKAKKGVVPMVIAGVAGTVSDLVYGYVKACKGEVVEYQRNNGNTGSGN